MYNVTCMMFICLICCLLIVSVDPDIGDKTTCFFDHENFLEKMANHLEIKNSLSWKVLEPGEKSRILWNFLFLCQMKL